MPEEIVLVFPHQLFRNHPCLREGRAVYLVEDPLFFGSDRHQPLPALHPFKRILHRASLLIYADELEKMGHRMIHLHLPAEPATTEELLGKLPLASLKDIHLADPTDYLVERRLQRFAKAHGIRLHVTGSPNFLSPPSFLDDQFPHGKKPFMARFYENQRRRMDVLMKNGEPVGGRFSFDEDNRKKLPKDLDVPSLKSPSRSAASRRAIDDAIQWHENRFGHDERLSSFPYPVTREEAEEWLDTFLDERFENFGPYEDAISRKHATVFHSVLTPFLNIGLLEPDRTVAKTLAHADKHGIPLASLEGFVRQIIGWREFMKAMYDRRGVAMRTRNFWSFERRMPEAFYTATTGIPPIDDTIRRVRRTGYCHHIERLMLLGNFMLLCRIHPDNVYQWFMELFIDAYDWVMVPNVYGMSQFADGGQFTTKPYLSGSNYVLKMSDYPKGNWCQIWDGLYWTFVGDHLEVFAKNHRLAMMAKSYERMSPDKKAAHQEQAELFFDQIFPNN